MYYFGSTAIQRIMECTTFVQQRFNASWNVLLLFNSDSVHYGMSNFGSTAVQCIIKCPTLVQQRFSALLNVLLWFNSDSVHHGMYYFGSTAIQCIIECPTLVQQRLHKCIMECPTLVQQRFSALWSVLLWFIGVSVHYGMYYFGSTAIKNNV